MGLGDFAKGFLGGGAETKYKQAKWGAGYPGWLKAYIQATLGVGEAPGADYAPYMEALKGFGPEATKYRKSIEDIASGFRTEMWPFYQEAIKSQWGQGARGMEELGLRGGALERGQVGMTEALGRALTQGRLQSEQESAARKGQLATLYGGLAGMLPQEAGAYTAPYSFQNQVMQQALQNRIAAQNAATGIPQYGQMAQTQAPGLSSLLGSWTSQNVFQPLMQSWAFNQGMGTPSATGSPTSAMNYGNTWQYGGGYQSPYGMR